MIEKTGIIGGLDLPEKAEHTRERKQLCRQQVYIPQVLRSVSILIFSIDIV